MTRASRAALAKDPLARFVRSLDGQFYTIGQVSRSLGVSRRLLGNIVVRHPELELGPSHEVDYGRRRIDLYDGERIEAIRLFLNTPHETADGRRWSKNLGRPRLWSMDELAERARIREQARYRLKQARLHEAAGDTEAAHEYFTQAEALMARLAEQYESRTARVEGP